MIYEKENKDTMKVEVRRGPDYNFTSLIKSSAVYAEMMPHGYIGDFLASEYLNWIPEVPIGIYADTGTGKNYFVENWLIPAANYYGKKILMFSNRNALGRQEKLRLAARFGEEYKLEKYSDSGVDDVVEFGCLTVVSYQQLEAWVNNGSTKLEVLEKDFQFVIADEAHYFTSDCKFNALTDLSLKYITSNFKNSVRIYLTATPEDAFPIIFAHEGNGGAVYNGRYWLDGYNFRVYMFEHAFNKYRLHAFNEVGDLIPLLMKANKNQKAIVFVDSKDVGASIVHSCGTGTLLTKDSKEIEGPGHDVYEEIVRKEKTSEPLLVCTAVLENGINIKDEDVKTVVLFSNEKARFLQMLGRVRCEENQVLDVYIANLSEEQARKHLTKLQKQLSAIKLFHKDPTAFAKRYIVEDEPISNVKGAFTVTNNFEAHLNSLCQIQIEHNEIPLWTKILNEMATDPYALVREKFAWLEHEFTLNDVVVSSGHDRALFDLILFLESYVGKEIKKDKQDVFKAEFSEKFKRVYGVREEDKTKDQTYGLAIIKACLEKTELPYFISSNRDGWKLEYDKTLAD